MILHQSKMNFENHPINTDEMDINAPSFLTTTIGQMKASNLQEVLITTLSTILYIHKLQIQTSIDKKYYDELDLKV